MKVFIVEYCEMVIKIFSSREKAIAFVKQEVKEHLDSFVGFDRDYIRKEKKSYEKYYDVYSQTVE